MSGLRFVCKEAFLWQKTCPEVTCFGLDSQGTSFIYVVGLGGVKHGKTQNQSEWVFKNIVN